MKYEKLLLFIYLLAILLLSACCFGAGYTYYEITLVSNYTPDGGVEEYKKHSRIKDSKLFWSLDNYHSEFLRRGHIIYSWNTRRDGSGAEVTFEQNLTFTERTDGLVLFAQWKIPDELNTPTCEISIVGGRRVRISQNRRHNIGATQMRVYRSTTNEEDSFELIGVSDSFVFIDTNFVNDTANYYYKTRTKNELNEIKSEFSEVIPLMSNFGEPSFVFVRYWPEVYDYIYVYVEFIKSGRTEKYELGDYRKVGIYKSTDSLINYEHIGFIDIISSKLLTNQWETIKTYRIELTFRDYDYDPNIRKFYYYYKVAEESSFSRGKFSHPFRVSTGMYD